MTYQEYLNEQARMDYEEHRRRLELADKQLRKMHQCPKTPAQLIAEAHADDPNWQFDGGWFVY